jgi:hypothetical protein
MLTQLNNGYCQPEKHHVSEWMHDDFGTMQYFYMLTKGNATLFRKLEHSAKAVHCKKKVSHFLVPSRDVVYQTLPGRE